MQAPTDAQLATLRADALVRRTDLLALEKQIAGAQRLLESARQGLRPKLDLQVGVTYNRAVNSGDLPYSNSVGPNLGGPSVTAQLNYQFPVQNRTARGLLLERSAQLTELLISQHDLTNAVSTAVDTALQSVLSSANQLKVAQEALQLYAQAVDQEIIKQKNGISTIIDVINVETRFVNARINFLQAQLAHATAVARLRLETDTFLPFAADPDANVDRFSLDMHQLGGLGPLEKQLSIIR
jgi:outer membrane protein TolC